MSVGVRSILPEQVGQLNGEPARSVEMRCKACTGLYVAGRGLRMTPSILGRRGLGPLARLFLAAVVLVGCGPRANIPPRPVAVAAALDGNDPAALLARTLAPTLYLHPREWFPLERVVAVVHPAERLIAYHMLWRDDVHGSWIPFTVPTDQEVAWVAYDSTGAPSELITFWHGKLLRTDWRDRGPPKVDVQWGKHGSLPHRVIESDLPRTAKLNSFYLFTWLGLPDIWLGNLTRPGPWCFCRGYNDYRSFESPLPLGDRIDVIVKTIDPHETLKAVFGARYSRKPNWP